MEGARDRQGRVDPIGLPEGIQEGEIHFILFIGGGGGAAGGHGGVEESHTGVLGRIFVSINSYCRTYLSVFTYKSVFWRANFRPQTAFKIIIQWHESGRAPQ